MAFDSQRCQGVLVDFRTINVSFNAKALPKYPRPYRLGKKSPGLFLHARSGWATAQKILKGRKLRAVDIITVFPETGAVVAFQRKHSLHEMLELGPYALETRKSTE
ncbi:MAG: hypothetical protein ACYST6_05695 [Planctomycetota bacterium]